MLKKYFFTLIKNVFKKRGHKLQKKKKRISNTHTRAKFIVIRLYRAFQ